MPSVPPLLSLTGLLAQELVEKMSRVVAVVGATGVVGREMLRTLERRQFPTTRVIALASERSAGTKLPFRGEELTVELLTKDSFKGVDIALFSAGGGTSKEFAPMAAAAGAVVIDNSSAWRLDPDCPLVVPEVNPEAARVRPKGIIANPNCSTIQLMVALKPLHDAAKIKHIVVSTYQATSGKGNAALEELREQTTAVAEGKQPVVSVFPKQMIGNVMSDWVAGRDGYSEEELKLVNETRKILGDPSVGVTPTCVRVPVERGHSEAVHLQFHRPMGRAEAIELLSRAPGIKLYADDYRPGGEPTPLEAADTEPVYVGRVREDLAVPGALNLWVVADNLAKGAALNAVQIAEIL